MLVSVFFIFLFYSSQKIAGGCGRFVGKSDASPDFSRESVGRMWKTHEKDDVTNWIGIKVLILFNPGSLHYCTISPLQWHQWFPYNSRAATYQDCSTHLKHVFGAKSDIRKG